MKFILLSGIVAILACQTASKSLKNNPRLDGRIVGGEETTIAEFPYQISLQFFDLHFCGGSILNSTVILTAAHCTYEKPVSYLRVRAGSSTNESGGVVVKVKKVIVNANFSYATLDYDSSLILLEEPLTFSDKIQPIALPNEEEYLDEPEISVVTGWGVLYSGGPIPSVLQKVAVPIVAQDKCIDAYIDNDVTPRMICAGYLGEGGKDACQGDSGGPLVANGKIHGITSWGLGCAEQDYPGVYTRVTSIREWIRDQINL